MEIRISKPETNPNGKMIKIRNLFKTFEDLNFWLVSDLGFRASNFARGTSSGKLQRSLSVKILVGRNTSACHRRAAAACPVVQNPP
jgi:hypothetical protein